MPIPFSHLCDLLADLEKIERSGSGSSRDPRVLQRRNPRQREINRKKFNARLTTLDKWFDDHRDDISNDPRILTAVYSALLPARRTDRIYGIKEPKLLSILPKIMRIDGTLRAKKLSRYPFITEDGDLGAAVERVMLEAEFPATEAAVTIEQLDDVLTRLGAESGFSSASVRRHRTGSSTPLEILCPLWFRLTAYEMKWATRMILKDLVTFSMPEGPALYAFHFLLPGLFQLRNTLPDACALMCTLAASPELADMPTRPLRADKQAFSKRATDAFGSLLMPQIFTKVGRAEFIKATSIKGAHATLDGRKVLMERKYDGEYCEIHIDLSRPREDQFRIYSKNGKDATKDRVGVIQYLREALKLDTNIPVFKEKIILLGELLVYSDADRVILPFHHIRKHVLRSGRSIGTLNDSPCTKGSHLMAVLFDILVLDSTNLVSSPLSERKSILRNVILPEELPGCVEHPYAKELDCSDPYALEDLTYHFARSIYNLWEGFVLKPLDSIYFDLSVWRRDPSERGYGWVGSPNAWIKLKKDYIDGLGDTADFCIVGGSSNASRRSARGQGACELSIFYIAVLANKDEITNVNPDARPELRVIGDVTFSIMKEDLLWMNLDVCTPTVPFESREELSYALEFAPELGLEKKVQTLFRTPLLAEILGGGFEKQTDCGWFSLRHPRVAKIHWDRGVADAVGWDELQAMAERATYFQVTGSQERSQEKGKVEEIVARLERREMSRRERRRKEAEEKERVRMRAQMRPPPTPELRTGTTNVLAEMSINSQNSHTHDSEAQRSTPTTERTEESFDSQSARKSALLHKQSAAPTPSSGRIKQPVDPHPPTPVSPAKRKRAATALEPGHDRASSPVAPKRRATAVDGAGILSSPSRRLGRESGRLSQPLPQHRPQPQPQPAKPDVVDLTLDDVYAPSVNPQPNPRSTSSTQRTLPPDPQKCKRKRSDHDTHHPLRGAKVFVPQTLAKFPTLVEKLCALDVGWLYVLPPSSPVSSSSSSSPSSSGSGSGSGSRTSPAHRERVGRAQERGKEQRKEQVQEMEEVEEDAGSSGSSTESSSDEPETNHPHPSTLQRLQSSSHSWRSSPSNPPATSTDSNKSGPASAESTKIVLVDTLHPTFTKSVIRALHADDKNSNNGKGKWTGARVYDWRIVNQTAGSVEPWVCEVHGG